MHTHVIQKCRCGRFIVQRGDLGCSLQEPGVVARGRWGVTKTRPTVVSRLPGIVQDPHLQRMDVLRGLQTDTGWKTARVLEFPAKSGGKHQSTAQDLSDSMVQTFPLVTALPSALFWEDLVSVQVVLAPTGGVPSEEANSLETSTAVSPRPKEV